MSEPRPLVMDLDGVLRIGDPALSADAEWRERAAARIDARFGAGGPEAVRAWAGSPGRVDPDVLDLIQEQRAHRKVALLTNATDRLRPDLAALGIAGEFDLVVNSSDHGVAKPDPRIFEITAQHLGCSIPDLVFVDDTRANVDAAHELGATARRYTTPADLGEWLARRGM